MAEVLPIPRRPDGQSYYSGSPLKRSATSYSSFMSGSPTYSSNRVSPPTPPTQHIERSSRSLPSSTTTSAQQSMTDLSHIPSFSSTPASSVFSTSKDDVDEDEISFPLYDDGVQFIHQDEPLDLPPSPQPEEEKEIQEQPIIYEEPETTSVTGSTRSDSPLPTPTVADDSAVKDHPSRHVDYLSHEWREEDIWSSWRHIVSQRKVYGQRSRLENASWRTWSKTKHHLPTVSPETLNWLKESDVTWLYGPLQPAATHPVTHRSPAPSPRNLSKAPSFLAKKPILKKRSMSEVMLQRSISSSSLLKQAAASVQAQQSHPKPPTKSRPAFLRAASDFVPSNSSSNPVSRDQLDYFSSRTSSSGDSSPTESHKRHIRFDDKVEQCIAVECKDNEYDGDESDEEDMMHDDSGSDSDSDDGVVMMKRPRRRKAPGQKKPPSRSSTPAGRIIEKLPDTTLKYRIESPDISQQPPTPFGRSWSSSKLAQSPSQETIRPENPSRNFLLPPEEDDEDEADLSFHPSSTFATRRDSVAVTRDRSEGKSADDYGEGTSGLRRTPSGMFMPYEDDEDDIVAAELGLLGKVSDTINTARDIAHVIWNVGWRK